MVRKLKVYLDTSVISALFDKRNPERKRITENFFSRRADFDIYISGITVNEIEDARSHRLREKMLKAIEGWTVLRVSEEIIALGEEYVARGAIPQDCFDDASHIATAVLNGIEHLLSWNFQHIVRSRTRAIVREVNRLRGLSQIIIITPRDV